jgi:hypothetical protein
MTLAAVLVGVAVISPASPVCQVGKPCSKPAAYLTLTFTHGAETRRVVTTSTGAFRIRLAAGRWTVHAGRVVRITPSTVLVTTGTTHVDLAIDTGIR